MTSNVSTTDRIIRLVIAAGALVGAIALGLGSAVGVVLILVAVVMVATAVVGFCPLYRLFGISTRGGPEPRP